MGRGNSGKSNGTRLQPIQIDDRWAFHPSNADFYVDPNDIAKNPIRFVGVGKDRELADLIENGTIQTQYIADTVIDISKLQSIQAFVLRSGMNDRNYESGELPYVVLLDGKYYLVDGNHRVARAKLNGQKTVHAIVSVQQRR